MQHMTCRTVPQHSSGIGRQLSPLGRRFPRRCKRVLQHAGAVQHQVAGRGVRVHAEVAQALQLEAATQNSRELRERFSSLWSMAAG